MATFIAVIAMGCGPSRVRWDARYQPGEGAFAVVPLTTPLRTRPDVRAPLARLGRATSRAVLRVRRARAGWVELETLGPPTVLPDGGRAEHCATSPRGLSGLRLVVYAEETALAPVTTRTVHQVFPDGTSIDLARGVPLEPLATRGLFRAFVGPLETFVRLERSELGTRYLPGAPEGRTDDMPDALLAAEALSAGAVIIGIRGQVAAAILRPLPVHVIERRGGEVLVEHRSPCGILRVRAPAGTVAEASLDGATNVAESETAGVEAPPDSPGESPPAPPEQDTIPPPPGAPARSEAVAVRFRGEVRYPVDAQHELHIEDAAPAVASARAGATVRWSDGREAGVAVEAVGFAVELAPSAGRRCFERRGEPDAEALTLCFDAADLEAAGGGAASRLADPRPP